MKHRARALGGSDCQAASDPGEWPPNLMGEEGDRTRPSPFPPTDPTTNPTSADARTSTARNAGEDSSSSKSLSADRAHKLVLCAALALGLSQKSLQHYMLWLMGFTTTPIRLPTVNRQYTQSALLNDKKLTPVSPHVLLYMLVITSPRPPSFGCHSR